MRLDFNHDGAVSMDDMRKNLHQFYEFLKNYDYIEATTRIKSNMYDQALKVMQKDQKNQEAGVINEGDPIEDDIIGSEQNNLPSEKI